MTNKEIAQKFDALANIMELYDENPFKIRSYQNAYIQLRKMDKAVSEMPYEALVNIKGIGKAMAEKIQELLTTGKMQTYEQYIQKTPQGVCDMLLIKGFGAKKVRAVWKELGVESLGELLYACTENRLVSLKGFGEKTQVDLIDKINYLLQSQGKYLYATLEKEWNKLSLLLKELLPNNNFSLIGSMRRRCIIVEQIEVLTDADNIDVLFDEKILFLQSKQDNAFLCRTEQELPLLMRQCKKDEFGSKLFLYTGNKVFVNLFLNMASSKDFKHIEKEEDVFLKANVPYIIPELRDSFLEDGNSIYNNGHSIYVLTSFKKEFIKKEAIKGILHTHTLYSDGTSSIKDMASYVQSLHYQYIGITDHSKSAFYANGMKEDRVKMQWKEIDLLNEGLKNFIILKGIEVDILNDGTLDYEDEILKDFDFIIASIHSNLKMDKTKATNRLIKAIEHPKTNIIGHPTGRLLLARIGYEIDYERVLDACAANKVAIELNANPQRLDIDASWLPSAMKRNVYVSINPDAHSIGGISDINYGVHAARKGGLTPEACLNALDLDDLRAFFKK